MKRKFELLKPLGTAMILCCFALAVSAQDGTVPAQEGTAAVKDGISFEHGLSWKEIKEKAKKENKFIFMDCFTTWCGPCKMMSKDIFPQKEVGDVFNDKFINVKAQMDKSAGDDEHVKKWYDDAAAIAKQYNVMAYPTFLYFSPDGELVHLHVGGTRDPQAFIKTSLAALDPSTQYITKMKTAIKEAGNDPEALRKLALEAKKNYDGINSRILANAYLTASKDVYTPEHLAFMNEFTTGSSDVGFNEFVKHADKIDAVMGKGFSQKKISMVVFMESGVYDALRSSTPLDRDKIEKNIRSIVPGMTDLMIGRANLLSLQYAKKKDEWLKQVGPFLNKYIKQTYPEELSGYARFAFDASEDPAVRKQALEWSRQALSESETPEVIATYASLLYKTGKKDDAITFQKKAVALSEKDSDKSYMAKSYRDTLTKMEKGELN